LHPKFIIFLVFTIGFFLASFWGAFGISGGGEHPKPPPPHGTPLATSD